MNDLNSTPPLPGSTLQRGLAELQKLLTPDERADDFDALAEGWIAEYGRFDSPVFDHQLLKLIQTDWLHRRALLSIARAEHTLAWAEAQHEPCEQTQEISKFIRRATRRCAAYEKRFENAFRRVEALRKARSSAFTTITYLHTESRPNRHLNENPEHN